MSILASAKLAKLITQGKASAITGVAKAGKGLQTAATKSTGVLGRVAARAGKLGALGGAAALGALSNAKDGLQNFVGSSGGATGSGSSVAIIENPIIDVPALVAPLELEGELLPTAGIAKPIDLVTETQLPAYGLIDPKRVVENYFDDDYRPIPIESAVPIGASFVANSKAFNLLENKVDFLALTMHSLMRRLSSVEDSIDAAILQNQNTLQGNERRRDEEDVERKSQPDVIENILSAAGLMTGGYLSKFAMPAIALAGASMAAAAEEAFGDDEETIGEKLEFLDDMEENYVKLAAAYAGAKSGGLVKSGSAGASAVKQAAQGAAAAKIAQAKGMVKASPVMTKTKETVTAVANSAKEIAKKVKANPVVAKIVSGLKRMMRYLKATTTGINTIFIKAKDLLAPFVKLTGKALKGLLAKPIKWFVIFEGIMLTIQAGEAYMLNPSPEAEADFHKNVKERLNRIIDLIGGTYIGALIGTTGGAALGTLTLPLIGTFGGGLIGAIAGLIVGEALFTILPIDTIVNAFYDHFLLDKINAFDNLAVKMLNHVKKELSKYADPAKDAVDFVTGGGLSLATAEDIDKDYAKYGGSSLPSQNLIFLAKMGAGTDENAVSFALSKVESVDDFNEIAEKYESEYNEPLIERLQRELSGKEYSDLGIQLESQFTGGSQLLPAIITPPSKETETISRRARRDMKAATIESIDTEALESAIAKGVYDRDIIGDSEIDREKVSLLTTRELKAIIYHDDLDQEDMTLIRDLYSNKARDVITAQATEPQSEVQLFVDANKEIPSITTTGAMDEKSTLITPIFMPNVGTKPIPDNPAGSSPGQSGVDSAKPSFAPRDAFLADYGFQT